MEGKIYKIGNKCYKTGNNFFMYNPTESNAPIAGLFSPRDMEVGIIPNTDSIPSLRGKKGIFICNAGADSNPLNGSIVIRDFYDTSITLKTIDTSLYDSVNRPLGIALDLENDIFYTASINKICKIRYSDNTVLGSYTNNDASFHDVFLDLTNNVLYTTPYYSGVGYLMTISTTVTLDTLELITNQEITGGNYTLIISADLINNILFISSWQSFKVMSFIRVNSSSPWIQKETLTISSFQPYGLSFSNNILYVAGHPEGSFNGTVWTGSVIKKYTVIIGTTITYNYIGEYSSGGEGILGNNPTGIILDTFATIPRLIVANSSTPPNSTYSGNSLNFIPLSLFP